MEFNNENVNGVFLSLKINNRENSSNSRQFTISYKCKENRSRWPILSLFLAILFNVIAFLYVRVSVTALLVIFITLSFLAFFWFTHSVQSETLLVVPSVGIQSSVKYVWGKEDNFIPWSSVDDIIINEVIKMNRVLYFLTVLVKNIQGGQEPDTKLIPLFKYTKPRLIMLEKIYSEMQTLLMESKKKTRSGTGAGDIG